MASIVDQWQDAKRNKRGKRWLVRWSDQTGAKSKAFERKIDATNWKKKVEYELHVGTYIDPSAGKASFTTIASRWRDSRTGTKTTKESNGYRVAALIRHFGDYNVGDIKPSMIEEWKALRAEKVQPSTVNQELWCLRTIFEFALDDELIRRSPVRKVRRLPLQKFKIQPWSLETIEAVLAAQPKHIAPVAWLAFGAGLRKGEALGVGVDDIDFDKGELNVNHQLIRLADGPAFAPPKRDSYGIVPLPASLLELLAEHIKEYPPTEVTLPWEDSHGSPKKGQTRTVRLLCLGRRGAPQRSDEYDRHFWWPALEAAGIKRTGKRTGLHHLRHCYASYLLAEGKAITVVQKLMRHDDLAETVGAYAHLVPNAEADYMKGAIASMFTEGKKPWQSPSTPRT